ncbi:hypothetical protein Bpfe_020559 [Biomphalaria pfeifferi]|uniref:Uncharacterized protein n=1 Tax=Biomphalaria pfeifferi TaxID=112525 RepID=A0AAD8B8K3_BIOPF|nr:hypothetical protein Bpfe_020559 [Biomphalaria pfeifferi]
MNNHNVSHENQDAASFQPTKWDMCALCQKNTKEKLQCPANARQTNQGSTYVTLAKNLTKFGECGALSPGILTRHESSKSPAMMKHAMDLVMQAVKFLNPGQIPVITADQPLFAIAKQIQWKCPEFYGENKITLLLGGLHIEMSFLKTVGTLLKDSGWVEALVNAKVATSGCAESFLNGSHVTRTRRAHRVVQTFL